MLFSSTTFPKMMPALKSLATSCSHYSDSWLGRFNFARADFRAMDGSFYPSTLDLYAIFDSIDFDRLKRLDQFFTEQNYRPLVGIRAVNAWEVQYQGPSRIKASPLLRIHFDPRFKVPLQVDIKCASTSRIIPLVYKQPRFLQEDFARRVHTCRADACNWCKDRKGLGPSIFEVDGLCRTICWYHDPTIPELNEDSLRLVQQYAVMHAALAEAS
jgi:hypothetical protein